MQIEHPNFLIKIYFVNIKQTTQLQLVPEDKVAILRYGSRISAKKGKFGGQHAARHASGARLCTVLSMNSMLDT